MLEQIKKFSDAFALPIILVLCILMFFRSCSTGTAVTKIEKRIESMESTTSTLSKGDVDSIVKSRLYDFLIFEDDLDKGKTSLSDIRIKISSNEK
jgi:hypothetical protein